MAVYPLKKWGRVAGVLLLVLGGGLSLFPVLVLEEGFSLAFTARSAGLFFAGVFVLSMRLVIGSDRYSAQALGIGRSVRFGDVRSLSLRPQPGGTRNKQLVVVFERDGKERRRTINKIDQYEGYEQFLREIEMYSGKRMERSEPVSALGRR